jgi:hypothetical protein
MKSRGLMLTAFFLSKQDRWGVSSPAVWFERVFSEQGLDAFRASSPCGDYEPLYST